IEGFASSGPDMQFASLLFIHQGNAVPEARIKALAVLVKTLELLPGRARRPSATFLSLWHRGASSEVLAQKLLALSRLGRVPHFWGSRGQHGHVPPEHELSAKGSDRHTGGVPLPGQVDGWCDVFIP